MNEAIKLKNVNLNNDFQSLIPPITCNSEATTVRTECLTLIKELSTIQSRINAIQQKTQYCVAEIDAEHHIKHAVIHLEYELGEKKLTAWYRSNTVSISR